MGGWQEQAWIIRQLEKAMISFRNNPDGEEGNIRNTVDEVNGTR